MKEKPNVNGNENDNGNATGHHHMTVYPVWKSLCDDGGGSSLRALQGNLKLAATVLEVLAQLENLA